MLTEIPYRFHALSRRTDILPASFVTKNNQEQDLKKTKRVFASRSIRSKRLSISMTASVGNLNKSLQYHYVRSQGSGLKMRVSPEKPESKRIDLKNR